MDELWLLGEFEEVKKDFEARIHRANAALQKYLSLPEEKRNSKREKAMRYEIEDMATFYDSAVKIADSLAGLIEIRKKEAYRQGFSAGLREGKNQVLDSPTITADYRLDHRNKTMGKWPDLFEPYDPLQHPPPSTIASNPRPPTMPGNR